MTAMPSTVVAEDAARIAEDLGGLADRLAGRTVLVTGATGMVGSCVVDALLAIATRCDRPVRVLGLVRSADKARTVLAEALQRSEFELIVGDVSDPSCYAERAVDFIVHAASPATPAFFASDPVGVIRANTLGTFGVLESARRHGAHVSFISTMEVYGQLPRADPGEDIVLTESDAGVINSLDLRSAYPESKRLAETLCLAYAAQYGVRSDIVRLSHTYGPGMAIDDARVQAEFIRKALDGEPIVLKSDGSMTRTYTYIADAAAAVMRVMLTATERRAPEAFNVADEASRTSIRRLAETVLAATDRPADDLVFDVADADKQMWSRTSGGTFLDCSRIRALGWAAHHQLADGIARTIRHHRDSAPDAVAGKGQA